MEQKNLMMIYGLLMPIEVVNLFFERYAGEVPEAGLEFFVEYGNPIVGLVFDSFTDYVSLEQDEMNSWVTNLKNVPHTDSFMRVLGVWTELLKEKVEQLDTLRSSATENTEAIEILEKELDDLDLPDNIVFNWFVLKV